jgi:hypothetical protein
MFELDWWYWTRWWLAQLPIGIFAFWVLKLFRLM